MKRRMLFLVILAVLISSGCKKDKGQTGDLLKKTWTLSQIQSTGSGAIIDYPTAAGKDISIVFTDSSNVISFSGICNNGTGTYSYSSKTGAIHVVDLRTTLIACSYVAWENYTVQNLLKSFSYKIEGNSLIIFSKGDYNLYFTK